MATKQQPSEAFSASLFDKSGKEGTIPTKGSDDVIHFPGNDPEAESQETINEFDAFLAPCVVVIEMLMILRLLCYVRDVIGSNNKYEDSSKLRKPKKNKASKVVRRRGHRLTSAAESRDVTKDQPQREVSDEVIDEMVRAFNEQVAAAVPKVVQGDGDGKGAVSAAFCAPVLTNLGRWPQERDRAICSPMDVDFCSPNRWQGTLRCTPSLI